MADLSQSTNSGVMPKAGLELDASVGAKHVVRQLRRNWARRFAWRTFFFVGLPTVLAIIYYACWASNQYESVAVIAIHGVEQGNLSRSESILGNASGLTNSARELLSIRDYILSHSMFEAINPSDRWIRHYQSREWDVFSRLSSHTTKEQAYRFYLTKVDTEFDSSSGNLTLRVRAFESNMAKELAEAILENGESMLDELSNRVYKDLLRNAEIQLAQARESLILARRQMAEVLRRNSAGDAGNAGVGSVAKQSPGILTSSRSLTLDARKDLDELNDRARLELDFAERAYESSISAINEIRAYEIRRR